MNCSSPDTFGGGSGDDDERVPPFFFRAHARVTREPLERAGIRFVHRSLCRPAPGAKTVSFLPVSPASHSSLECIGPML